VALTGETDIVVELVAELPGKVVVPSEYWNVQGPVPVKLNVKLVLSPLQIVVLPVTDAVGNAFIVRVIVVAGPVQPVLVSVMKTEVVLAAALLNPSCAFVGAVPAVNMVVKATSLYQV
jgi:hypothetical protein